MRIWDVPPAELDRQALLGEHRELHAIWTILTENRSGYRRHPEVLRWTGRLGALFRRHEALVAEMERRGYRHRSPLDEGRARGGGPCTYQAPPLLLDLSGQRRLLAAKALGRRHPDGAVRAAAARDGKVQEPAHGAPNTGNANLSAEASRTLRQAKEESRMSGLPKGTTITWLGHAMFAVETPQGKTVVIDPFIEGNPTFPAGGRDRLAHVDAILVSHAHNDHMGDAASLSRQTGAPVVAVHEISVFLAADGVQSIGMNKSGTVEVNGVRATMVGADHSSGYVDASGKLLFGGEAAGWVLHLGEGEGEALYHAGDTGLFGDMALIGEMYGPSVALLPIGGHFTMGPREAARAAQLLKVERVIPMHFGTFPPLTGRPDALKAALSGTDIAVDALEPGQSVSA